MRPITVYTLNELQRLVPSITEEHILSSDNKVKEKVFSIFWALGCDLTHGIEVQKGLTTKNRFKEEDTSVRFVVSERVDDAWTVTFKGYASSAAKEYTEDYTLVVDLFKLKHGGF